MTSLSLCIAHVLVKHRAIETRIATRFLRVRACIVSLQYINLTGLARLYFPKIAVRILSNRLCLPSRARKSHSSRQRAPSRDGALFCVAVNLRTSLCLAVYHHIAEMCTAAPAAVEDGCSLTAQIQYETAKPKENSPHKAETSPFNLLVVPSSFSLIS